MDNKITAISLAAELAQSTGKSKKICEDFIREYFKVVAETMEQGDSLKIKGFGTFKVVEMEARTSTNVNTGERQEIPAYKKVVFTPAKELASEINAPFSEFESVEMEDDVPEDVFYEPEELDSPEVEAVISDQRIEEEISEETQAPSFETNENDVNNPRLEEGSDEEEADDDITYEAYNLIEEEKTAEEEAMQPESTDTTPEIPPVLPVYDYEEPKSRFGIGFLVGSLSTFAVCVVVFIIGCFFDWWPENLGSIKDIAKEEPQIEEVVMQNDQEVEQTPTPEPVYDTVSTTRYLTTIAREHYGNFNFWPYIYLENESILGHPDRITPGTQVVVPDLSKYGVSPDNKEDVDVAKKKAAEIYARFK